MNLLKLLAAKLAPLLVDELADLVYDRVLAKMKERSHYIIEGGNGPHAPAKAVRVLSDLVRGGIPESHAAVTEILDGVTDRMGL